jgi:DNA-binding IclR family transcriptional regulator
MEQVRPILARGVFARMLLDYIREHPGQTPREIKAATGWRGSTLSMNVNRLIAEGRVERDDYCRYRLAELAAATHNPQET